jgi:hypothetical protein
MYRMAYVPAQSAPFCVSRLEVAQGYRYFSPALALAKQLILAPFIFS